MQTIDTPRTLPLTHKFIVVGKEGQKLRTVCVKRDPSTLPRWMKRQIKRERSKR